MGHLRRNFTRLALLGPIPSCLSDPRTRVLSHSVVSDCLRLHGLQPTKLLCPWNFPGKNPGMGYHVQGIFLTQGSNLCLL